MVVEKKVVGRVTEVRARIQRYSLITHTHSNLLTRYCGP